MLALLWMAACLSPERETTVPPEGLATGADSLRLFYRIVGAGRDTVVVLHGFQGNSQHYLAPDLAGMAPGHAWLFYDQRGGGLSDAVRDGDEPGLAEHVADLEAMRVRFGFDKLELLAHSGGAYIAVQYALEHPNHVDRLVLVSPGSPTPVFAGEIQAAFLGRLDSLTWDRLRTLDASLRAAEDPAGACLAISRILLPNVYLADSSRVSRMKGSMCDAPESALRTEPLRRAAFQASVSGRDWVPELGKIEVPVLIIHGDRDPIPVEAAEMWRAGFRRGELRLLDGADHLPWLDRPEEFSKAVAAFLDRR